MTLDASNHPDSRLEPMLIKRRRYVLYRVADEPHIDFERFFRGEIHIDTASQCSLLCPVRGVGLTLTGLELSALMTIPGDAWIDLNMASQSSGLSAEHVISLIGRGILLSDPAHEQWPDLFTGEQTLADAQWLDLAAVYHAHTGWSGVGGEPDSVTEQSWKAKHSELELRRERPAPPHFVWRSDVREHLRLTVPLLSGPFFDALLRRRTTRSFRSAESLPRSALEAILFAVFGTHGIKETPAVTGLKRTSPSGGALHPIEAYLLVMNVEGVPSGIYHYETGSHTLGQLEPLDEFQARELAYTFTAGQDYFARSHVLVMHVARFDRNFWKYAEHRKAYKAVLVDSAHLSQTLYLVATHLNLGAFYTAAINDVDIGRRLRLPSLREAVVGINGLGLAAPPETDDFDFDPLPYSPIN